MNEHAVDGERKTLFLDFVRSLLQWDPQKRPSALEAYAHPWLKEFREAVLGPDEEE